MNAPTVIAELPPRMLNDRQAARYLGIGRSSFRNACAKGKAPQPIRIGRRVLWDRYLLDRYFDTLSGLSESEGSNSWDDL